jgi:hypothetical protein
MIDVHISETLLRLEVHNKNTITGATIALRHQVKISTTTILSNVTDWLKSFRKTKRYFTLIVQFSVMKIVSLTSFSLGGS